LRKYNIVIEIIEKTEEEKTELPNFAAEPAVTAQHPLKL